MTNLHHGIFHEFVYVSVVLHGVLVVKITAKGEHDVVCSIVAGLKEDIFNECIHTLINVVAHEVRIILRMKTKWIMQMFKIILRHEHIKSLRASEVPLLSH